MTNGNEQRQVPRTNLFAVAALRVEGSATEHQVKLRNLSPRGLMADGAVRVTSGATVWIEMPEIDWVEGVVVWVQDDRFGVAFRDEVDPVLVGAASFLDVLAVPSRSGSGA